MFFSLNLYHMKNFLSGGFRRFAASFSVKNSKKQIKKAFFFSVAKATHKNASERPVYFVYRFSIRASPLFKNSRNNTIFFFACQPFEQNSREIFFKFFCARFAVLPCGILLFCGRAAFCGGGCRRRNNAACPGKTPPTVRWKMRANKPDMKRLLHERSRDKRKKLRKIPKLPIR